MRAYKFRSASQIEFVFDILLKRRLYCADWRRLNDPMEGMFASVHREAERPYVQQVVMGIRDAKRRYKVASLAGTFDCHLLWAHYAGGFDGVAIELDLPDNDPMVRPVLYRGVFSSVDIDNLNTEDEAAQAVLFSKYREWSYEQEIRILHDQDYFPLHAPVRRVIAGHRMGEALFDALHLVCDKLGIEVRRAGIGDEGIDADQVKPPRLKNYRRRQANGAQAVERVV